MPTVFSLGRSSDHDLPDDGPGDTSADNASLSIDCRRVTLKKLKQECHYYLMCKAVLNTIY